MINHTHLTTRQRWSVAVESVEYGHPAAVALRAAMDEELSLRHADRLAAHPDLAAIVGLAAETVVYTGVAVTGERRPAGHVALRRTHGEGDLELKRMYVVPHYRGGGVGAVLLAAAEQAACALGARRVILLTCDRQPDAVRLFERAGYMPISAFPPYGELTFSRCFAKEIHLAGRS